MIIQKGKLIGQHSLYTASLQARQLARKLEKASRTDSQWERNDYQSTDPMRGKLLREVQESRALLEVIQARLSAYEPVAQQDATEVTRHEL